MDIMQFVTSVDLEGLRLGFTVTIPVDGAFRTLGDGYWSNTQTTVKVHGISMFVGLQDDGEGYWGDGDLGILHEDGAGLSWDSQTQGLIYTDSGFMEGVRTWLIKQGWDVKAVEHMDYSEQGMQDVGRVSCDAYEFAEYLRSLYLEKNQTI